MSRNIADILVDLRHALGAPHPIGRKRETLARRAILTSLLRDEEKTLSRRRHLSVLILRCL